MGKVVEIASTVFQSNIFLIKEKTETDIFSYFASFDSTGLTGLLVLIRQFVEIIL